MIARVRRAALAVAFAGTIAFFPAHAGAAPALAPPPDPSGKGFIGLCDKNNKNIAGGSLADTPFVWKAVASQRPPADMIGRGQNTILNIYQPRPGVPAAQWSGDQLTGSSFYTDADAPAAQATLKDLSLGDIVKEYPPMVNGLYELRMYFGIVNGSLYSQTYPATFIQVNGNRWSVVAGGTVNCAAAGAQSLEVLSGVLSTKQAYGSPLPKPSGKPSASASSAPLGASGAHSGSGSADPSGAAQSASSSKSSSDVAVWVIVAIVVVGATGAGLWWRRRARNG